MKCKSKHTNASTTYPQTISKGENCNQNPTAIKNQKVKTVIKHQKENQSTIKRQKEKAMKPTFQNENQSTVNRQKEKAMKPTIQNEEETMKNDEHTFKLLMSWVRIPWVTLSLLKVIAIIFQFISKGKKFFMGNREMCRRTCLTSRNLRKCIQVLADKKFIKITEVGSIRRIAFSGFRAKELEVVMDKVKLRCRPIGGYEPWFFEVPCKVACLPRMTKSHLITFEDGHHLLSRGRDYYPSDVEISKRTGESVRQIERAHKLLRELGLMESVRVDGKRYLNPPGRDLTLTYSQKDLSTARPTNVPAGSPPCANHPTAGAGLPDSQGRHKNIRSEYKNLYEYHKRGLPTEQDGQFVKPKKISLAAMKKMLSIEENYLLGQLTKRGHYEGHALRLIDEHPIFEINNALDDCKNPTVQNKGAYITACLATARRMRGGATPLASVV